MFGEHLVAEEDWLTRVWCITFPEISPQNEQQPQLRSQLHCRL